MSFTREEIERKKREKEAKEQERKEKVARKKADDLVKRQEQAVLQTQKRELEYLMQRYPKEVLQGKQIDLDANWKKAFVSFMCMAVINVDVSRKELSLSSQITDSFNEAMKKGSPIELNDATKQELQIAFRLKNMLLSTSDTLEEPLQRLDEIIRAEKDKMDMGLYSYYIGAKGNLQGTLKEQRKTAADIDSTIAECFKKAIDSGVNMQELEAETLKGIDTRGDIKKIQESVYKSVGLQI